MGQPRRAKVEIRTSVFTRSVLWTSGDGIRTLVAVIEFRRRGSQKEVFPHEQAYSPRRQEGW